MLSLATATTLNYTSPLFLVLLTVAVLRERPRPLLVGTVALGFAGVVLLLHPTFQSDQAVAGALGLASGLCAAAAYLTTRELGRAGEPSWRIVLYFALVSTVGAGLAVLAGGGFHRISGAGLLVLVGLGATGTLGQLAMTRAYREGDTLTVGSLGYSTVLFTALLSMALWGEVVPASSWLAMGLIGASGILATRATVMAPRRVGAAH
jgi:S-adenosylmethionine uptake transporter